MSDKELHQPCHVIGTRDAVGTLTDTVDDADQACLALPELPDQLSNLPYSRGQGFDQALVVPLCLASRQEMPDLIQRESSALRAIDDLQHAGGLRRVNAVAIVAPRGNADKPFCLVEPNPRSAEARSLGQLSDLHLRPLDLKVSFKHTLIRPPAWQRSRCGRAALGRPSPSSRGFTRELTVIPNLESEMSYVTTSDGVEIYYKDWGPKNGKVIYFHHGWPLSSDDWDAQMLFFVNKGFRVVAHDRRGHGRSTQVWDGHDMDHYADDVAAVVTHLGVQGAMHVGHSTGGGEVVRYIARHGEDKVSKAVLISAVPPLMVKTAGNPEGTPKEVFDDFQAQLAANRAKFYYDVPAGPFYGYNRPGAEPSDAVIWNWWRQGMMGGAKAHYDGIVAFSQTDFTEDLKGITIPVLVIHGDDDQVVPYADSGLLSAKLVKNGKLNTYKGAPHGIPTTHADQVNQDLLDFVNS